MVDLRLGVLTIGLTTVASALSVPPATLIVSGIFIALMLYWRTIWRHKALVIPVALFTILSAVINHYSPSSVVTNAILIVMPSAIVLIYKQNYEL